MKITKLQRYIALLISAAIIVAAYVFAPAAVGHVMSIVMLVVNNILQDKPKDQELE